MIPNPKPKLDVKDCLICQKEFSGRGKHAVTCSSKCSQAYQRAYIYIGKLMRKGFISKIKVYLESLK